MLGNEIDVSIKGSYVSLEGKRHPFRMENGFLIHRWVQNINVILYILVQSSGHPINFGHPSLRASESLLRSATKDSPDSTATDSFIEIREDCEVC